MNSSEAFFDEFADTFDTFYDDKRRPFMQWVDRRFRRDMFLRFEKTFEVLGELKNKSVLDIGCGSGLYLADVLRSARPVISNDKMYAAENPFSRI